jgi:hypothetical protein
MDFLRGQLSCCLNIGRAYVLTHGMQHGGVGPMQGQGIVHITVFVSDDKRAESIL